MSTSTRAARLTPVTGPSARLTLSTRAGAGDTATVPDPPTIGVAAAGNASASVAFTPPLNNGGSAITGYTATSTPESHTGTGAASPITVTGLANGAPYTFTAHATNAVGNSAESAASNQVIPSAGGGTVSIFTTQTPGNSGGAGDNNDATAYTLGTLFVPAGPLSCVGARWFYPTVAPTQDVVFALWSWIDDTTGAELQWCRDPGGLERCHLGHPGQPERRPALRRLGLDKGPLRLWRGRDLSDHPRRGHGAGRRPRNAGAQRSAARRRGLDVPGHGGRRPLFLHRPDLQRVGGHGMTMYDVGDRVLLETLVQDTTGALVNTPTLTLAVTKPDGTAVSPAPTVTNTAAGGVYTAQITVDAAGIWQYVWTAAGTVVGTEPGQLTVRSPQLYVVGLEEIREQLRRTDNADDSSLRRHLAAATRYIASKVGPIGATTFTERYYVLGDFSVRKHPLISVTSLTPDAGTAYDASSYRADTDLGQILVVAGIGAGWHTLVYRAGWVDIPDNFASAGRIIVKHLWETENGGGGRRVDVTQTGLGFAVPNRAIELLNVDKIPGV